MVTSGLKQKGMQVKSEQELKAEKALYPETIEQLTEYINSLVDRPHDYGTCVYAMSLSAVAAFNFVASKLGATGFQASCADLDILRRTRGFDGPFKIVDASDWLYPQYSPMNDLMEFKTKCDPWLAEQARQKLEGHATDGLAVESVVDHWKKIVEHHNEDKSK